MVSNNFENKIKLITMEHFQASWFLKTPLLGHIVFMKKILKYTRGDEGEGEREIYVERERRSKTKTEGEGKGVWRRRADERRGDERRGNERRGDERRGEGREGIQ